MNYLEKLNNKKVLVTGGLGFVGHNLVKRLLHEFNCQVIVVDDCSNSKEEILGEDIQKVRFHKASVLDQDLMSELIEEVNIVFHLACKQISASGSDPKLDLQVNAQSTLEILEKIRHSKLPLLERFVYTSSCSVYGSYKNLPASEDGVTRVLSNYAATKLLGENYTMIYGSNYDIDVSCVRYSNVYGPGQSPTNPYCGVLGKFIHNALTKQPLTIIGDGEQTRDYSYIDDAVEATLLAAVHPRALNEVFNVGTSIETSVNELAEKISSMIPETTQTFIPERDIDNIRRRSVDIEKIHRKLGWNPQININRGLALTIEWYRKYLEV